MKPILKWIGGKSQILDKVLETFPTCIDNYHEPFVGGGSVLLGLLEHIKDNKIVVKGYIYAYDANFHLINLYKHIQVNTIQLYDNFQKLIEIYDSIHELKGMKSPKTIDEAKCSKESYYYWIRKQYNHLMLEHPNSYECAALFLFLNKTCFRGMYREGPNGFNVPYGHYKKISIINKEDLENFKDILKNVKFIHSDFRNSLPNVKQNDFVYLDPPYYPESETSFVGYTYGGFSEKCHERLIAIIKNMHGIGAKFVLSNSSVQKVRDVFSNFCVTEVDARRAINAKKPGSNTKELIISN